jgi:hypothetical protein
MIQTKKQTTKNSPSLTEFKDNGLAPKGKTKHTIETDWPVKESVIPVKRRKIKKTENARLP